MQEESGVAFNAIEGVDMLVADVLRGNWDGVLSVTSQLSLHPELTRGIHEQIFLELLELRDVPMCRRLVEEHPVFLAMQSDDSTRYEHLKSLLDQPKFVIEDKETRRRSLAEILARSVTAIPPSCLLVLIGHALRWQQHCGKLPTGAFDVFRNTTTVALEEDEAHPVVQERTMRFSSKSHPLRVIYSPDGRHLVTASVDGYIEVWEPLSGQLNKELQYQARDSLMMHNAAVSSIVFSRDSELLASGCQSGTIKVWTVLTGHCLRKFEQAHFGSVTCLCFAADGTQLLSGSSDGGLRVHGLRSGKCIKEFRGHTSFVNQCLFSSDGSRVLSGSSDGTLRVWDSHTTELVHMFRVPGPESMGSADVPVRAIVALPREADVFVVCSRQPTLHLVDLNGKILKEFGSGKIQNGDFTDVGVSGRGEWVFASGEDGIIYSFKRDGEHLEHVLKAHSKDIMGLAVHPRLNRVATYTDDGLLKIWKA